MTAFCPISPAAALELLAGIGVKDKEAALTSYVDGGTVRAYAQVTVTRDGWSGVAEVRDRRIHRETWGRIIEQGKIEDVWSSGCVQLDGEGGPGGRPAMKVIGIRFDERAVREAAAKHSAYLG